MDACSQFRQKQSKKEIERVEFMRIRNYISAINVASCSHHTPKRMRQSFLLVFTVANHNTQMRTHLAAQRMKKKKKRKKT